jgi:protein-S-isoprenylcysteine O-methyltransferase Ste14
MAIVVVVLRIVSLLAFAGPISLKAGGAPRRSARGAGERAPVAANLVAFGLFLISLFVDPTGLRDSSALTLAAFGALVSIAGAVLVLRSRAALGAAWSLVPNADQSTGLITSGPYARVRHPIYSGLVLVALGQALAFGSRAAVLVVLLAMLPTFAWRARAEEKLLSRTFGDPYALYRARTRIIIPYIL